MVFPIHAESASYHYKAIEYVFADTRSHKKNL